MLLIQGSVEVFSGNKEFQRKLKAAKALIDLGDYSGGFHSFENLVKEYSYEAEAWKEYSIATLTWMRQTKTVETQFTIHQVPIHSVCLKDIYDKALQFPDNKKELQTQWNSFWEDAAHKLEQGEYLFHFPGFAPLTAVKTVSTFHPAMKAAMEKANANARILNSKRLRYAPTLPDNNKLGWMPASERTNSIDYAFGVQIKTSADNILILNSPISCTDGAIIEYQVQSSANGRKCYDKNICPYCGGNLEAKLLSKECWTCGKIKRP